MEQTVDEISEDFITSSVGEEEFLKKESSFYQDVPIPTTDTVRAPNRRVSPKILLFLGTALGLCLMAFLRYSRGSKWTVMPGWKSKKELLSHIKQMQEAADRLMNVLRPNAARLGDAVRTSAGGRLVMVVGTSAMSAAKLSQMISELELDNWERIEKAEDYASAISVHLEDSLKALGLLHREAKAQGPKVQCMIVKLPDYVEHWKAAGVILKDLNVEDYTKAMEITFKSLQNASENASRVGTVAAEFLNRDKPFETEKDNEVLVTSWRNLVCLNSCASVSKRARDGSRKLFTTTVEVLKGRIQRLIKDQYLFLKQECKIRLGEMEMVNYKYSAADLNKTLLKNINEELDNQVKLLESLKAQFHAILNAEDMNQVETCLQTFEKTNEEIKKSLLKLDGYYQQSPKLADLRKKETYLKDLVKEVTKQTIRRARNYTEIVARGVEDMRQPFVYKFVGKPFLDLFKKKLKTLEKKSEEVSLQSFEKHLEFKDDVLKLAASAYDERNEGRKVVEQAELLILQLDLLRMLDRDMDYSKSLISVARSRAGEADGSFVEENDLTFQAASLKAQEAKSLTELAEAAASMRRAAQRAAALRNFSYLIDEGMEKETGDKKDVQKAAEKEDKDKDGEGGGAQGGDEAVQKQEEGGKMEDADEDGTSFKGSQGSLESSDKALDGAARQEVCDYSGESELSESDNSQYADDSGDSDDEYDVE